MYETCFVYRYIDGDGDDNVVIVAFIVIYRMPYSSANVFKAHTDTILNNMEWKHTTCRSEN